MSSYGAGGIRAGLAYVEATLRDASLLAGLRSLEAKINAWAYRVSQVAVKMIGVGMAVGAPLAGAAYHYAHTGQQLMQLSFATGISVEAASALDAAFQATGVGAQELRTGVRTLHRSIVEATKGHGGYRDLFRMMRIDYRQLGLMDTADQILAIADGLQHIRNETARTHILTQLFGKTGQQMAPLLQQGGDTIRQWIALASQLGMVVSTAEAHAATKTFAAFGFLKQFFNMSKFKLGAELAPIFEGLAFSVASVSKKFFEFIRLHGEAIRKVALFAAAITAAGTALLLVAAAIKITAMAMFPLVFALRLMVSGMALAVNVAKLAVSTYVLLAWSVVSLGRAFRATYMAAVVFFGGIKMIVGIAARAIVTVLAWAASIAIAIVHTTIALLLNLVLMGVRSMMGMFATQVFPMIMSAAHLLIASVGAALVAIKTGLVALIVQTAAMAGMNLVFFALAAAIVAGAAALVYFTVTGDRFKDMLSQLGRIGSEAFGAIWRVASAALGGISDAIIAGEWGLAWEIAVLAMERIWRIGAAAIKNIWVEVKSWFLDEWDELSTAIARPIARAIGYIRISFSGLRYVWETATAAMRIVGEDTFYTLRDVFAYVVEEIQGGIQDLQQWIANRPAGAIQIAIAAVQNLGEVFRQTLKAIRDSIDAFLVAPLKNAFVFIFDKIEEIADILDAARRFIPGAAGEAVGAAARQLRAIADARKQRDAERAVGHARAMANAAAAGAPQFKDKPEQVAVELEVLPMPRPAHALGVDAIDGAAQIFDAIGELDWGGLFEDIMRRSNDPRALGQANRIMFWDLLRDQRARERQERQNRVNEAIANERRVEQQIEDDLVARRGGRNQERQGAATNLREIIGGIMQEVEPEVADWIEREAEAMGLTPADLGYPGVSLQNRIRDAAEARRRAAIDFPDFSNLGQTGDGLAGFEQRSTPHGTFSAVAASGLGAAQTVLDRILGVETAQLERLEDIINAHNRLAVIAVDD